MSSDRASESPIGTFVFAAIAIVLVIVDVAVTAWLGGRANASGRRRSSAPSATGQTTSASNVSDIVAAGAHDYNQFACAQCHGIGGVGRRAGAEQARDGVHP